MDTETGARIIHETEPRREFSSSHDLGKLAEALAKAQGEIHGAKKDAANPFFKSRYADLASVWDACRAPLSKNGLAVIQLPGHANGEGMFVDSILMHSSGEWISSRLFITPVKDDPQGIGSAITYARRYGLQAIVGIAPEDDDGEAAMGRQQSREKAARSVGREEPRHDSGKVDTGPYTGDWHDARIHFGKDKDKHLGDLPSKKLKWYQDVWHPKPYGDTGFTSKSDEELRRALDASMKQDSPADGKPANVELPPKPVDDEIPF